MELMATCLEKLLKAYKAPFPEHILGKVSFAVGLKHFENSYFVLVRSIILDRCFQTVKALNYLKEEHGVMHRGELKRLNDISMDECFIIF